jgi:hypothetical protein
MNPVAAMLARHYCVAGTEPSHPVRQAIAEIERLQAEVDALRADAIYDTGDSGGQSLCPHGEPIEDCNACLVDADFAFDAARERR